MAERSGAAGEKVPRTVLVGKQTRGSCGRVGRQRSGQSPSQLSDLQHHGLALVQILRGERAEFSWLGLGEGECVKVLCKGAPV